MSSCSGNSSNIAGRQFVNNVNVIGSRITTTVKNQSGTDGGIVSGVVAGDVIRYDVTSSPKLYVLSKADTAENSEIFGVVEKVTTEFVTVVMLGQINYPLSDIIDVVIDGVDPGGAGGEDVFFLSDTTAGKLQNMAPTEIGKVVKPILQRADNGDYNSIVHNYIGYQLGGDIVAHVGDGTIKVGDILTSITHPSKMGEAYVDASKSHELKVSDFSRFYEAFGTVYGYRCRTTIDNSVNPSFVSSSVNLKSSAQIYSNGGIYVSGKVTFVSTDTIDIEVRGKLNSDRVMDTSKELFVNNASYGVPVTVEVTHVFTPIVTNTANKYKITNSAGESFPNSSVYVVLKVRDNAAVFIPEKLIVNELDVLTKATIASSDVSKKAIDVAKTLNFINTDLSSYADKLSTTSQTNSNNSITSTS